MHSERYFLQFSYLFYKQETLLFGLTKLAAASTAAQRKQKAANTNILESRNLLQTATLVFPRSIVCSRLSNNINILAKKIARPLTGGMPPGPGLDPPLRLSVSRSMLCDKTKQYTANILTLYENTITLVFWHQQRLVGNTPSVWNLSSKPSSFEKHRLRQIFAYNVSTVRDSVWKLQQYPILGRDVGAKCNTST